MRHDYQPLLAPTAIAELRPSQMTVGMREVVRKRHQWRERCERDGSEFLGRHMIPVVRGPKDHVWLIDHHHLVLALHGEGERHVLTSVIADVAHLRQNEFLTFMENRCWMHPFDADGRRHDVKKLPKHVGGLVDDPYRSLAGDARRGGAFGKSDAPFAEFLWADFLRRRVKASLLARDPEAAARHAYKLARSREANHLPGWAGPEG